MPRKSDNQTNIVQQNQSEQNQVIEMEIEDLNEKRKVNEPEDIIPDLTGIEQKEITDKSGHIYNPDIFVKCFIPQNELAQNLTTLALRFILAKKGFPDRNISTCGPKEIYIINGEWYNKWKEYSRYGTMKRIIRAYQVYENRPIQYTPNEKKNPGQINNNILLIRNKVNLDERNILVSKYNDCLDTKLIYSKDKGGKKDIKLLTKERFDLLNNYFKCDYILKANRIQNDDNQNNKNYDVFGAHFNIIFLPTLALFKSVNEENIENFKKNQNIIYDIYFKLSTTREEFLNELRNICKEKPQILSNMGVELNMEDDYFEIINHSKNFKFYIPSTKNNKTAKEMTDFIYSNETIEKIKNDKKISDKELEITKIDYFGDINNIFHLNLYHAKENLDKIEDKRIIFVEYILEDQQTEHLSSIFDIKSNGGNIHVYGRPMQDYNLDDFPLNKEENKYGLVGLNNLGNTCYMNTGLQCLSNCELLTKYFLGDYYKEFINKENPIGSNGEIVEKYSQLIHHLWYGNNECISPIQFKKTFGKMYNAFNDFRQQDTQEFMSYLLDALHEDLNKVLKKPYIETKDLPQNISEEEQFKIQKDLYLCRNQSFIADLIYGFYKSTIFCPNEECKNIIKSFEPFNMIALSLVNEAQIRKMEEYQNEQNKKMGIKILTVTFIPFKINNKPLKFPVKIKKDMDIFTFKQKIEKITGFNKNSFEIYKSQGGEFCCVKPVIYLLEEFLKGETKVYLFQIPPYVFGKPLDYFDRIYDNLNNNNDKFFLEEEKYEGNDLYDEYNKKEKKSKTDDELDKNQNRINLGEKEEEEKEKEKENKIKDDNDIVMNKTKDDENEINNNNDNNVEQDIEMKDESLNFDRNQWVKAEFYNYSYSKEKSKNNKNEEKRIDNSRIVYINKDWDNTQIYICILEMLEGTKSNLDDIKAAWFCDIKEVTKELDKKKDKKGKKEKKDNFNIYDYLDEIPNHPLFLQYLNCFNYNKTNVIKKKENWKNLIFPFDSEKYTIKKIINAFLEKNNDIEDTELLFKIIWKKSLGDEYKEGTFPIELTKSEKLEEILKNQREDEYLKKNNIDDIKEKKGKKKNKKLQLVELLNNFKEIEKLSKDNQWYCPKCKQFQLADKKMELYSVNEVIIIHLKRFRNNRKIENFVEFPLEGLDLTDYLPQKEEKSIYDLFAVANHVGGLHGGHYFAYCKNSIDNGWYEFNDSNVSKIEEKKVVSDNAYVLFYNKRRENKINEEELFKKPFIEIDYSKYI